MIAHIKHLNPFSVSADEEPKAWKFSDLPRCPSWPEHPWSLGSRAPASPTVLCLPRPPPHPAHTRAFLLAQVGLRPDLPSNSLVSGHNIQPRFAFQKRVAHTRLRLALWWGVQASRRSSPCRYVVHVGGEHEFWYLFLLFD